MVRVPILYLKDVAAQLQGRGWTAAAALPLSSLIAGLPSNTRARPLLQQWQADGTCSDVATLLQGPLYAADIRRRFGAAGEMDLVNAVVAWLTRTSVGLQAARVVGATAGGAGLRVASTGDAATGGAATGPQLGRPADPAAASKASTQLKLGMSRRDLLQWAGSDPLRRVVRDLTLGDVALPAQIHEASRGYLPSHERLESLLTNAGQRSYYYTPSAELLQQVLGLFELAERPEEAALQADRALLAEPPSADPEVEALRQHLLELRQTLRETALPRPAALRRCSVVEVDLRLCRITALDRDAGEFCKHHPWPSVYIDLSQTGACMSEEPPCQNRCAVALAAVDAALAWVSQPKITKQIKLLAHALVVPPWQLAVEQLDEVLAAHGKFEQQAEQQELGWRVNLEFLGRELEPVWVGSNRKGEQRIKKASLKELRASLTQCRRAADRKVIELLRPQLHQVPPLADAAAAYRQLGHALALLADHPQLFRADNDAPLRIQAHPLTLQLIEVDQGACWQARLGPLTLAIAAVQARLQLSSEHLWLATATDTLAVAAISPAQRALLGAIDQATLVPAVALPQVLQRLPQLARLMEVVVPDRLRGEQLRPSTQLVLRLDALPDGALGVEALVRPLPQGPLLAPGQGQATVYASGASGSVWTERDLPGERQALQQLWAQLGVAVADPAAPLSLPAEQGLDLLAQLADQGERVEVQWAKARRQVRRAAVKHLRVEILDRPDWFGVAGQLEVDGAAVDLAAVLEAIRGRKQYVKVSGDLWLQLSEALRAHLQPVADAVVAAKDGLLVSPLQAGSLAAVVEAPHSPRWQHAVVRMRQAGQMDWPVPAGLCAELRSYQAEGYAWLASLAHWSPGALLADDMGLGKTLQALALLLQRRELGPALVVAPTSVESNWLREAERFAPGLRVAAWRHGDRADHGRVAPGDVLVISYDLLVRDLAPLATVPWATLVLDEAQSIKNATTQRWKAVTKLQAEFRLGLTGTPVENHIGELWAVMAATVPGLLGPWPLFQQRYAVGIERDGKSDALQSLIRVLKPFLLRRLKADVARDLPARLEIRVDVEPSAAERALYDQVRLASLAEIHGGPAATPQQQRFAVLAAITRLRQIACHPRLWDDQSPIPSAKLDHVCDLLVELEQEGHRALVFSQFVRHLGLLRERLEALGIAYRYLDGSTPEPQRRKEVKAFQEGSDPVFLISLKAGGTGLNLTAADYVFHLDPWWNPAVEDQATDRAHRIGQQRPVTVYRLVAKGTIEESILDLQGHKRELVASLLSGSGEGAQLSTEELLGLLGEVSAGSAAAAGTRPKPVAQLGSVAATKGPKVLSDGPRKGRAGTA